MSNICYVVDVNHLTHKSTNVVSFLLFSLLLTQTYIKVMRSNTTTYHYNI